MDAVQTRAGEDFELATGARGRVMQVGKRAELGPTGPILRAVGLGFGLGVVVMLVLTLLSR